MNGNKVCRHGQKTLIRAPTVSEIEIPLWKENITYIKSAQEYLPRDLLVVVGSARDFHVGSARDFPENEKRKQLDEKSGVTKI